MASAPITVHLGSRHAVAAIGRLAERAFNWGKEARPARAALELAICYEQRVATADARERPLPVFLQQGARTGPLGCVLTQHRILFGRQQSAPFFV